MDLGEVCGPRTFQTRHLVAELTPGLSSSKPSLHGPLGHPARTCARTGLSALASEERPPEKQASSTSSTVSTTAVDE